MSARHGRLDAPILVLLALSILLLASPAEGGGAGGLPASPVTLRP